VSTLFEEDSWRLHPDWVYCRYNYAGTESVEFATPEEEMRHFVARMRPGRWNWGVEAVRPLPKCEGGRFSQDCKKARGMDKMDQHSYVCNKDLVTSMLYDAMVTKDFESLRSPKSRARGST